MRVVALLCALLSGCYSAHAEPGGYTFTDGGVMVVPASSLDGGSTLSSSAAMASQWAPIFSIGEPARYATIRFYSRTGGEVMRIASDGGFFVNGRKVGSDREIYRFMRRLVRDGETLKKRRCVDICGGSYMSIDGEGP